MRTDFSLKFYCIVISFPRLNVNRVGMVVNPPFFVHLNSYNVFCRPCSLLSTTFREVYSTAPSRVGLLSFHTQADSGLKDFTHHVV